MKVTVTVIKADIGSIGGHTRPSDELIASVKKFVREAQDSGLIIDSYVGYAGDDIHIVMSHTKGVNNNEIHKMAWDAFSKSVPVAKEQGLYGAGQDLLVDSFSGNVRGMGPGVAEMEFDERPNEAFVVFAADKTEPGAFNYPLFSMFCDIKSNTGLLINPSLAKGVKFTVMDVMKNRVVELETWSQVPEIAAILMYPGRYVVESVKTKTGEPIVSATTDRLHNIKGTYVGKDDPAMIIRLQKTFPATEEACYAFKDAHFVAGNTRGSHHMTLMPVKINTTATTYFCNPLVSALLFSMHNGKLTGPIDGFEGPNWDVVRRRAAEKSEDMRAQGFVHPATLIPEELEYNEGYQEIMNRIENLFKNRG
ncbi:MAG: fructose 1,6-bisphosphatase [Candidatus Aenigmarchaeota archaeon]|nr:fructose 1,6-bisphosphatase [Candidatus Aenigmarchaeota archaeon]